MIIFGCLPETDGAVFRIHTTAEGLVGEDVPLELAFHLPAGYPLCLPGVSVNSGRLTRAQCAAVKETLLGEARKRLSEPMVHELVLWIQQNLSQVLSRPETVSSDEKYALPESTAVDGGLWMTLLRLDHMRARTKYVKAVEKWASELRLTGRLMFMGKLILILLQGDRSNIKVLENFILNMNLPSVKYSVALSVFCNSGIVEAWRF